MSARNSGPILFLTRGRPSTDLKGAVAKANEQIKKEYKHSNGFASELPSSTLIGIVHNPNVKLISPDWDFLSFLVMTGGKISSRTVNDYYRFDVTGFRVATVNSGVASRNDLVDSVDAKDFIQSNNA